MYLEPQTNPPPPLLSPPQSCLNRSVIWAKQQLCACITLFCTFLSRPCTTTTWDDQSLGWFENGKCKAINITISFSELERGLRPLFSSRNAKRPQRRRARRNGCFRRLFSSYLTSPPSSNWVTWLKGEKVLKDVKSIFQRRFHCCHLCRIVRSLMSKGQCTWQ